MLKKLLSVVYGLGGYLLFLGAFLLLVAFNVNLAPHSVSGRSSMSTLPAALIDLSLITMFGLQHGVMARPGFKRWWTRFVPKHLERSTYVWFAAAMVLVIIRFWQPIDGDLWNAGGAVMIGLYAVSLMGWLMVPYTSFLTGHFELFGLFQVYEYALGRPPSKPVFKEPALYRKLRHPMMLGMMIGLWATPHMTAGHLLFAGLMTSYILIGIYFEERDLVRKHGQAYLDYQERVPRLLPFGGARGAQPAPLRAGADTVPTRRN